MFSSFLSQGVLPTISAVSIWYSDYFNFLGLVCIVKETGGGELNILFFKVLNEDHSTFLPF